MFEPLARASGSRARTGILRLAHGPVATPAFVPLATRGSVRTLAPAEVAELGYELVLGNTFHLMLAPGAEVIERLGGLHEFMRWPRPIITDSGGFQVFSMGHGNVADEIKGRGRDGRRPGGGGQPGAIVEIAERGVRFRSPIDGRELLLEPETSMSVQAALGSDIALCFDECTPFHVTREYTARSTARTHRWLERCLRWHQRHGPAGQLVYGIVQGGTEHELRIESTATVAASAVAGVAIGGSLGREKAQMYEVVGWVTAELERLAPDRPRHLLGIGEVDDLIAGVELGIDTFDCAMPTRLARHGVALVPEPPRRWRVDLMRSRWRAASEPVLDGCPCPTCRAGFSRAYLHHLLKIGEPTAGRLLTLHNLSFIAALMADLRAAIAADRLAETAAALRAGAVPGGAGILPAATSCSA
jgi:queuine tRNA-ribosyltransferase